MACDYNQLLSTFCLVALIGVIAAIGGVVIAATTVGIIYCRGHRKKGMKIDIFCKQEHIRMGGLSFNCRGCIVKLVHACLSAGNV